MTKLCEWLYSKENSIGTNILTDEDELFYVYKGSIVIQLRDQPDITLREGELAVIPKGVEHCPKSVEPSYVLLFEPYVLQTRGD